jgi:hypothetical protein
MSLWLQSVATKRRVDYLVDCNEIATAASQDFKGSRENCIVFTKGTIDRIFDLEPGGEAGL